MAKKNKRKKDKRYYESVFYVNTCTHNPVYLFNIDSLRVWAADVDGARRSPIGSTVLNCTGISRNDHHFGRFSERLSQHLVSPYEILKLNWTDGAAPPVTGKFWKELPTALMDEGVEDLVVHCIGGHGRTGTALASMLVMVLELPAEAAIQWVRHNYCSFAIETKPQEHYIHKLDGSLYSTSNETEALQKKEEDEVEEALKQEKCDFCGWYNCTDDHGQAEEDKEEEVYYDCSQCSSPRLQFGPCYNCGWEDVPDVEDWDAALKEGLQELRDEEEAVSTSEDAIPEELRECDVPQLDVLGDRLWREEKDEVEAITYDDEGNPIIWDADLGCWINYEGEEVEEDADEEDELIVSGGDKPPKKYDPESGEWVEVRPKNEEQDECDTWAERMHWWD